MNIAKIGGGIDINIDKILDFLVEQNEDFIIVHGANATRDKIHNLFGFNKQIITSISGQQSTFTDDDMINSIFMAYAGLVNKQIVEKCQQRNINAIGLTGIDGQLIRGKSNRIKTIKNGKKMIVRDRSARAMSINKELLDLLLENSYTPVITVPILNEQLRASNSENDDIVSLISKEFDLSNIYFFIEAPGFLADINDNNSTIPIINKLEIDSLISKSSGRMKRKLMAIQKFMTNDTNVWMIDGRNLDSRRTKFTAFSS